MDTVTVKTSELIDHALDWAVAKCEGYFDTKNRNGMVVGVLESRWTWVALHTNAWRSSDYVPFKPSANWTQGGPIIERENITVRPVFHAERTESGSDICRGDGWSAHVEPKAFWVTPRPKTGPTPLIAAMRCYVASKLGNTVEIPKELMP